MIRTLHYFGKLFRWCINYALWDHVRKRYFFSLPIILREVPWGCSHAYKRKIFPITLPNVDMLKKYCHEWNERNYAPRSRILWRGNNMALQWIQRETSSRSGTSTWGKLLPWTPSAYQDKNHALHLKLTRALILSLLPFSILPRTLIPYVFPDNAFPLQQQCRRCVAWLTQILENPCQDLRTSINCIAWTLVEKTSSMTWVHRLTLYWMETWPVTDYAAYTIMFCIIISLRTWSN